MSATLLIALLWASRLGAVWAVVIYFVVLARRPQWIRLLNGSSLFFTGVALGLVSGLVSRASEQGALYAVAATVALLVAAVVVQSWAALRNRRAWDGVERRRAGDSLAEGDVP